MITKRTARLLAQDEVRAWTKIHEQSMHGDYHKQRIYNIMNDIWIIQRRLDRLEGIRSVDPCGTATALRPEDV